MKKNLCSFLLTISALFYATICATFYTTPASAEIYKWTDRDGKTHFGDKKVDAKAQDISATVKKQNIDTSAQEHQKLETLFRKENDADRAYKMQKNQPSPQHEQACKDAKEKLLKISGRVQFVDDNGKPVNVSEAENRARAEQLRKDIKEHCPPD